MYFSSFLTVNAQFMYHRRAFKLIPLNMLINAAPNTWLLLLNPITTFLLHQISLQNQLLHETFALTLSSYPQLKQAQITCTVSGFANQIHMVM